MDFSVIPMEDGIMDSPPNGGKPVKVVNSHFPMKCPSRSTSLQDCLGMNPETQRKLYDEEMLVVASFEV